MIPPIIYGTAWKEARTADLTREALAAGFRGIDTANQRKHYDEASVGVAVAGAGVPRDALFLQTKFTYERGQDHRLPYDPKAPIATQVAQSFDSSLAHLGVERIDSYVLHGPEWDDGWSGADREAWGAMEELVRGGRAGMIGVSNISAEQLVECCESATVAPAIVQNRCFARRGWDREVRAVCRERSIVYQGFSLLTANARELSGPVATSIARRLRVSVAEVVFRFAAAIDIVALTGTSNRTHMELDLAALDLALEPADVAALEHLAG